MSLHGSFRVDSGLVASFNCTQHPKAQEWFAVVRRHTRKLQQPVSARRYDLSTEADSPFYGIEYPGEV